MSKAPFSSQVGKVYGLWTVMSVYRPKPREYRLMCRCICGHEKSFLLSNLLQSAKNTTCRCSGFKTARQRRVLFGEPITLRKLATLAELHPTFCGKLTKSGMDAEQILEKYNPTEFTKLKLSRTKKRGRPIKTLDGREVSHEEVLRGLVQSQVLMNTRQTENHRRRRRA